MRLYSGLYTGVKAKKHRFAILQGIRKGRAPIGSYVLCPPSNPRNLLDIIPAWELSIAWYKEQDPLILGIADGYADAAELAAKLIARHYRQYGTFAITENEPL